MRRPPTSILAIGALFLALGCLDLYLGVAPIVHTARPAGDDLLVAAIGVAALLGGTFLLFGRNWARWLLAAWMAFHVAVSIFHEPLELLAHVVIFGVITYFLFRSRVSTFFRRPPGTATS